MKRFLIFILCATTIFFTTSCSGVDIKKDGNKKQTESETTEETAAVEEETECKHEYDEEITKEPGYGYDGILVKMCTICSDVQYEAIPALPDIFELKVTDKSTSETSEGHCVLFDIEITNTSDKKIESIKGTLSVMPKDCINELKCEFDDLNLEPHSTKKIESYGYVFDYDKESEEVSRKVYNADFDSMKFSFTPTEVKIAE